jgi:hypothetical protein
LDTGVDAPSDFQLAASTTPPFVANAHTHSSTFPRKINFKIMKDYATKNGIYKYQRTSYNSLNNHGSS